MGDELRLWLRAARPVSFTAAVVPALIGTLLAAPDAFSWWRAVLAILGSVAILAGTNFINDYFDHRKGVDGPGTLGQAGAIQRGEVSPRGVFAAGIACFAIGAVAGLILAAVSGWSLVWLGVASVLAGFLYTGWPLHLAYIGLGEVTVFIFMGPIIVLGAWFVQVESWDWEPVVASLPIGFLVTAILHVNNLRDIDNDRERGKRTIPTVIGRDAARVEMYVLLAATYLSLVVAVVAGAIPWPGLIALVTLPAVPPIVKIVAGYRDPRKVNFALARTAILHMQFGAVLALGIAANWVWQSL
jgi:1,4-dihydroxy-2-naphthoate octaprenyltransferase